MDPVTGIGLAANVVQFVIYGFKILSKGNEVYKSADGALVDNQLIEKVAKDLESFLKQIKNSPASSIPGFAHFRQESLKLVNELLEALDKLKVKGSLSRCKSIRKALKAVHSKDKISKWLEQLQMLRDEYNFHTEIAILESVILVDVPLSSAFQKLEDSQKDLVQNFIQALSQDVDHFASIATYQYERTRDLVEQQAQLSRDEGAKHHRETRAAIRDEIIVSKTSIIDEIATVQQQISSGQVQIQSQSSFEHGETRQQLSAKLENSTQNGQRRHEETRLTIKNVASTTNQSLLDIIGQNKDQQEIQTFQAQMQNEFDNAERHAQTQDIILASHRSALGELRTQLGSLPAAPKFDFSPARSEATTSVGAVAIQPSSSIATTTFHSLTPFEKATTSLNNSYSRSVASSSCLPSRLAYHNQRIVGDPYSEDNQYDEDQDVATHYPMLHRPLSGLECICHLPANERGLSLERSSTRLAFCKQRLGNKHPSTVRAMVEFAERSWCQKQPSHAAAISLCNAAIDMCTPTSDDLLESLLRALCLRTKIYLHNEELDKAQETAVKAANMAAGADNISWERHSKVKQNVIAVTLACEQYVKAVNYCRSMLASDDFRYPEHPYTLDTRLCLIDALTSMQHYKEAEEELNKVLRLQMKDLGPHHLHTLHTISQHAVLSAGRQQLPAAESALTTVLDGFATILAPEHPYHLQAVISMAMIKYQLGKLDESKALVETAFPSGNDSILSNLTLWIDAMVILSKIHRDKDDPWQASTYCEQILQHSFEDSPCSNQLITVKCLLGSLYRTIGRNFEALQMLQNCEQQAVKRLGPLHANVIPIYREISNCFVDSEKIVNALQYDQLALDACEQSCGINHEDCFNWRRILIDDLQKLGRIDEELVARQTLRNMLEAKYGIWHDDSLNAIFDLGTALQRVKQFKEASSILLQAYDLRVKKSGPHSRASMLILYRRAEVHQAQGQYQLAEQQWKQILHVVDGKSRGYEPADLPHTLESLSQALVGQGKYKEAIPVLQRALGLLEELYDYNTSDLATTFMALVKVYRELGLAEDGPELIAMRTRAEKYKKRPP